MRTATEIEFSNTTGSVIDLDQVSHGHVEGLRPWRKGTESPLPTNAEAFVFVLSRE